MAIQPEQLLPALTSLKKWSAIHRKRLIVVGLTAFIGGLAYSIDSLGLTREQIRIEPLLWNLLLLAPLGAVLISVELILCARACGCRITPIRAISATSVGSIANLLPVPGSMIARGAALVGAGARLRDAGVILIAAGAAWIGVALFATGAALLGIHWAAIPVGIVGALVATGAACLIARFGGWRIALALMGLRIAMVVLQAWRLFLCFAVIVYISGIRESIYFSAAYVTATASAVIPAGLGLTEGISALMALLIATPPASAFTAMALNRLQALAVAGVIILWIGFRASPTPTGGNSS